MEKELALALDFKSAPKELQDAATAHFANIKATAKLKTQLVELNRQLTEAEASGEKTAKAYRVALNSWDPGLDKAAK